MRFNKYIWNLYKDSTKGKETLKYWTPIKSFPNDKFAIKMNNSTITSLKSCELTNYISGSKVNWSQLLYDYFTTNYNFSGANFKDLYSTWIHNGIEINNFSVFPANKEDYWVIRIETLSKILYGVSPEFFFPYKFDCEFNKLTKICLEFEIPLPEIPKKKDWFKRALYYIDLCNAFLEFRKMNNFSPPEFCAFLYDFAPNNLKETEDTEMPNPSKVWFVGGNKNNFEYLDNSTKSSIDSWQCNLDTRRGDIIVMYCLNTSKLYSFNLESKYRWIC